MKNIVEGSEAASPKPQPRPEPAASGDLSREIAQAVGREPRDRVRCVRVFGDFYRCNWWGPTEAPPASRSGFDWGVLATHYVRRSVFYKATSKDGRLEIEEVKGGSRES